MKSKLIYIVLFIAHVVPAWAQSCVNGIHLNKHILCTGETISAAPCDNNGNIIPNLAADYNYGESLTDTATRVQNYQHIYSKPGIYKIRQVANQVQTSRIAHVLPKATPQVQLSYCEGKTISINITSLSYNIYSLDSAQMETYAYDQYIIDFGDGTIRTVNNQSQAEVHTYTSTSNNFNVSIRGVYDLANCGGDTSFVVDFSNKPFVAPLIRTLTVLEQSANGKVELAYSGFGHLYYRLDQKTATGVYQAIDTLNPQTQDALWQNSTPLNTESSIYCYQLHSINYCDESRNLPSDEICTTRLRATVDPAAGAVQLEWPRYPISNSTISYQLFRNDTPLGNSIAANGPFTYTDSTVACGQVYNYRLAVTYQGQQGTLRSVSATQTVRAESTRPLKDLTGFYSTIENNRVVVRWNKPQGVILKNYTIYRNGAPAASLTDTMYVDEAAQVATTSHCYTISYEDSCGNRSAISQPTCPIQLRVQTTGRNTNELRWTPYRGWESGVANYVIEYLDADDAVYKSISMLSLTNYIDNQISPEQQVIRYRIKAEPNDPLLPPSYSNIVEIKQRVRLIFPNAFNPLGHPENRVFKPQWRYVASYNLQVFNRWGEIIFESFDISEGWNGTLNGRPAPEDMYVYKVVASDETGDKIELTGTVMLLRKE